MKRAIPAIALTIGICWIAGVSAQGRNFAGTWTIDAEKTAAAAPAAGVGGVMVARGGSGDVVAGGGGGRARSGGDAGGAVAAAPTGAVARGGGGGGRGGARGMAGPMTITIDANSFTLDQGATPTVYRLDGSISTIPSPAGDLAAKASWKGDRLVVETTYNRPDGALTTTTTWYLEGDSLVREVSTPTADGQSTTRKTYFKRS